MTESLDRLNAITTGIVASYEEHGGINHIDEETLPARSQVTEILDDLMALIFPGYYGTVVPSRANIACHVDSVIDAVFIRLTRAIHQCLGTQARRRPHRAQPVREEAEALALQFLEKIPALRELLKTDVQGAYQGDPAAHSIDEVILCYPSIEATATYRLAHELYALDIPLLPRIMTERAHRRTGIDIHPGARIGTHFFIDHGTGVVIGETTVIGERVKLYQGVTLGALSFHKGPDGTIPEGTKRHPTLEDDVTIYSNATILGGDTVIGKAAVIGANAWIISSVPPGATVTMDGR